LLCWFGRYNRRSCRFGFLTGSAVRDPGCVKTPATTNHVEIRSQIRRYDRRLCSLYLWKAGNGEFYSTGHCLAHVFTQAGPKADISRSPQSEAIQSDPTNACGSLHPSQGRPRREAWPTAPTPRQRQARDRDFRMSHIAQVGEKPISSYREHLPGAPPPGARIETAISEFSSVH